LRLCAVAETPTESSGKVGEVPDRAAVLRSVAARLPRASVTTACVLVAVDGVDGAGKTTFADALAATLRRERRAAIRISLDDFHNPRAVRYRRGRNSPDGFWLDAYNYERFTRDVLEPLGAGGSRKYRPKAHHLATDVELNPPTATAAPGCVVVVDGLFLHREELRSHWHFSVFLQVSFEVSARRMAERDGTPPDLAHPRLHRYIAAQRRYFEACDPLARATVVIDNTDPASPRVTRWSEVG
jgi:uridine kinase